MGSLTESLRALGRIRDARNELERARDVFPSKQYTFLTNELDKERKAIIAGLPQVPVEAKVKK